MWKKIRKMIGDSCDLLELFMACLVLLATVVAIITLWRPLADFFLHREDPAALLTFIGYVFNVVIAIEFLKMLSHPSADTILEVLAFLVARHMVLDKTSVYENLISIICIAMLFAIKKYLNLPSSKDGSDIFVSDFDLEKRIKKRREERENNLKAPKP
ncbi:MAG: hypothetical protein HFI42_05760 [Lachnospiraceae bacterium]|nr:hypothetical protein [Lachnospiraceae bacterium]MCI9149995.1 hypothetical protein [Lachnospiraceae bacterium]